MITRFQDNQSVKLGSFSDWVIVYVINIGNVQIRLSASKQEVDQQGPDAPGIRIAPSGGIAEKYWWKGDLFAVADVSTGGESQIALADFQYVGGVAAV